MKVRTGFVSNSSSSSFVCSVCGQDYSGYDACLEDGNMSECVKGHIYCNDHSLKPVNAMDVDDKRRLVVEYSFNETEKTEALQADDAELEDMFDAIRYDVNSSMPSYCCPCCSLSSITAEQVLEYLLHERHTDRKQVEAEIRVKYKTYDDMLKDIT